MIKNLGGGATQLKTTQIFVTRFPVMYLNLSLDFGLR